MSPLIETVRSAVVKRGCDSVRRAWPCVLYLVLYAFQGIHAIGCAISKLALYTSCAGLPPSMCLPICLDTGAACCQIFTSPARGCHPPCACPSAWPPAPRQNTIVSLNTTENPLHMYASCGGVLRPPCACPSAWPPVRRVRCAQYSTFARIFALSELKHKNSTRFGGLLCGLPICLDTGAPPHATLAF